MDFKLPELGEGIYEAELVSWLVKPGDSVRRGQSLMEVMTDKATMEVPSPFAGTIQSLHAEPGAKLKIGELILTYEPESKKEPAPATQGKRDTKSEPPSPAHGGAEALRLPTHQGVKALRSPLTPSFSPPAAPSVRQMARQLGIELSQLRGSGPGGRILIEDLARQVQTQAGVESKARTAPQLSSDYGKPGTRVKLIGVRRAIAEHMVQSARTVPHYSYVDECDVTELVRLRDSLREELSRFGIKLTYMAFIVKAVVAALKQVPMVNSSLDEEAGEIVFHDHYHIGIAVDTPAGLMVPVIHDADRKDVLQIAREIEQLSVDARTGKSKREDLRGGTFTITSIGSIGGLFSTPIINYPEVGILGVGKIVKQPRFAGGGSVRPVDTVYLSFSFDHRVVDGAVGAVFGNAVMRQLQNPAWLLLPSAVGSTQ